MKIHERIIGPDGTFQDFPEHLRERAIRQGNDVPKQPETEPEDTIPHGVNGKAEIEAKNRAAKAREAQRNK